MKLRYRWHVINKVTGEVATYNSPYGKCSKDSVIHSPEVIEWAKGNPIGVVPCLQ